VRPVIFLRFSPLAWLFLFPIILPLTLFWAIVKLLTYGILALTKNARESNPTTQLTREERQLRNL
jgi:hypothetical protein